MVICIDFTEVSHVVQVRAEGPGLGASALSGRVGLTCETRRITPTGLYPGTPGVLETSDD